jgi:hypothetical protein
MKKPRLKKNDLVLVVAGKDRGRQGKILRILPSEERAIVERVNLIKRHTRRTRRRTSRAAFRRRKRRFTFRISCWSTRIATRERASAAAGTRTAFPNGMPRRVEPRWPSAKWYRV